MLLEGGITSLLEEDTTGLFANAGQESTGDGGDITVNAGSLGLQEGARISTALDASRGIPILADVQGTHPASRNTGGNITIKAGSLQMSEGAQIAATAFGPRKAGNVGVEAQNVVLEGGSQDIRSGIFANAEGTNEICGEMCGNAGNIIVKAGSPQLKEGAQISARTFFSPGDGGSVGVEAENIVLEGGFQELRSGLFTSAARGSTGDAGSVTVEAGRLQLKDGARISASTEGPGKGGSLAIHVDNLQLSDGGEIRAITFGPGVGGLIDINAANVDLRDGGSISSQSTSGHRDAGHSGNILIRASDTLRLFNGSSVNVETAEANAGSIDLKVGHLLHLRDQSSITTSVAGGGGDGGNIFIDPVFTVLDGGSEIVTTAREGRGGNIRIDSDFVFASADSRIDASSELGVSGVVDVESPETDVVSGALALPESFLDAARLLSERCGARALKGASSFIVSGRGGVPPGPETVLPSFSELSLKEAPGANGASVSEGGLAQGTVECRSSDPLLWH